MIKNAVRLYLTQKHIETDRKKAIQRTSKLFHYPIEDIELIYNQWRKDYTKNIIRDKKENNYV